MTNVPFPYAPVDQVLVAGSVNGAQLIPSLLYPTIFVPCTGVRGSLRSSIAINIPFPYVIFITL